jgi:tetratricopeptide (TPR) repeat protein
LLLPVILLAILEICLRLGGYGYDPHFFKRIKIGNEDYFVQNDEFSYRFFPPETARSPGAIRMPVRKTPGTYRIFVLGESAAMGDPEPAFGAYRYLEMLLREKYPDKKFEIINVAFTAINSHVIVPIARECAEHEGDLWIIYMGNNEMVGPFGAATVFGRQAPPLPYVRMVTALQSTRIGQLFTSWSRKLRRHDTQGTAWGGMEMFMNNQIAPDSPLKETVYRNFEKNLDDIVRAGIGSGAKVLLNTVAVNLKDCPPFASLNGLHVSATDRAQSTKLFADGCSLENQSNFTGAVSVFEQATKLDPQFADLQYRWGQCFLAEHSPANAQQHLQLACDNDALPFRADSRINSAVRNEQNRINSNQLIVFDAANALAAETLEKVCGPETFYEHVHFDFDGSYCLGLAWAEQIAALLPPNTNIWVSQATCEQMLGLSDWNRALVIEHMIGRMQQPPLNGQANNASRMAQLQTRADTLRHGLNPELAARTRGAFLKQLELAPDDYMLRENFALFLQSVNDLSGATAEWRRIQQEMPHDFLSYFEIGRLLGSQNQPADAEAPLRRALAMRPSLTEGWIELGNALAMQGHFDAALTSFDTALKQRPQDPQTIFRRGKVLAQLNRHAEAMDDYRAAIRLNSSDWALHYELAGELDSAGQLDEARKEFGEAARLNPDNSRTHFNYGVLLAKLNRLDEAEQQFEETIRLEPAYSKAQQYLAQIKAMKAHAH